MSDIQKAGATAAPAASVAVVDRRPFFEKALSHGVAQRVIDAERRAAIIADGAKGTVQVAQYFGSSHLFAALDSARKRVVTLVSLYLEEQSGGDLDAAARSLAENTFLSHSRGGNAMLKSLHALPESSMFDSGQQGQSLKDFQDERTLARPMTLAAYRKQWQQRLANARLQGAALWFAEALEIEPAALDSVAAESVIRTGLLCLQQQVASCPGRQEFAAMLGRLREGAGSGKPVKKKPASGKRAAPVGKPARSNLLPKKLLDAIPAEHHAVADAVRREIDKQDLPLLADATLPLDEVFSRLELRYFLRETGLEDIDDYDAFVSQEWLKLTKGKEDQFSRYTLFLCIAAGVPPKTALTVTEARTLVRAARKSGLDGAKVSALIESAAPFSIRESLLSTWEDEWLPEAEQYLCDPADEVADNKYLGALRYLTENGNVKKAG